jgi:hypothetical protein
LFELVSQLVSVLNTTPLAPFSKGELEGVVPLSKGKC